MTRFHIHSGEETVTFSLHVDEDTGMVSVAMLPGNAVKASAPTILEAVLHLTCQAGVLLRRGEPLGEMETRALEIILEGYEKRFGPVAWHGEKVYIDE